MKPKKLSYKKFLLSLKLAPRLAVELLFENRKGELFFIKRTIDPFKNKWHVPGGFVLKGESIESCIKRVAKEEANTHLDMEKIKFLGIFETIKDDPRGHIIHYVVRVMITTSSAEKALENNGSFFKNLPQPIIPAHRKFLTWLK